MRRTLTLASSLVLTVGLVAAPPWATAQESDEAEPAPRLGVALAYPGFAVTRDPRPLEVVPGSRFAVVIDTSANEPQSTPEDAERAVTVRLPRGVSWVDSRSLGSSRGAAWTCRSTSRDGDDQVVCRADGVEEASLIAILQAGPVASSIDEGGNVTVDFAMDGERVEISAPVNVVDSLEPQLYTRAVDTPTTNGRAGAGVGMVLLAEGTASPTQLQVGSLAPNGARSVVLGGRGVRCDVDAITCRTIRNPRVGAPMIATSTFTVRTDDPLVVWNAQAQLTSGSRVVVNQEVPLVAFAPPPESGSLVLGWTTAEGQSLVQGGDVSSSLTVTNIANQPQRPAVTIDLPRGISVASENRSWTCRQERTPDGRQAICRGPRLASDDSSVIDVKISATRTAPVGSRALVAQTSEASAQLVVHVADPGDPVAAAEVWVKPLLRWRPWVDGSIRDMVVGERDRWRFIVSNVGGDRLAKGRSVTLVQRFAPDVTVEVLGKRAQDCQVDRQVLTCEIPARKNVEPMGSVGAVTVALTPTRVGSRIVDGPVRTHVTKARRGATRSTVIARAVNPEIDISLDTSVDHGLVQGASDVLRLRVERRGDEGVRGLEVRGNLPPGVRLTAPVQTRSWSCETYATDIECRLLREIPKDSRSPIVRLPLTVAANAPVGVAAIDWEYGYTFDRGRADLGVATTAVSIAPPLDVELNVPTTLTSATDGDDVRASFAAHVIAANSRTYPVVWKQECLEGTADSPGCGGVSSTRVQVLNPANSKTTVVFPDTDDERNYRFSATIAAGTPWQITRTFTTTVVTSSGTVALLGDRILQLTRPPKSPPPPRDSSLRPPLGLPTLGTAEDTGGLPDSISLGSGIRLKDLRATSGAGVTPITADGRLEFTAGPSTASAKISMSFTDAQNWTARVVTGSSGEWNVLPGLSLDISGLSGTVASQTGTLAWGLQWGTSSTWQPTTALSVKTASASVSDACPEQVSQLVHCVEGDLFIILDGSATLDGGELGSITANVDAVIRTGDETGFAIAGGVDASVSFAPGISFSTNPSIFAYRTLTPTNVAPTLQDTSADEPTVTLVGDMALEPFGTFAHMQAIKNDKGWVVAAYVDEVTIAGNDALGSLAEGLVAYATYDATLTNTQVPSAPPVKVNTKQVVAAGTYQAPSWFVKSVGEASVSATFGYDPEKKQFSEKITLATPNLRIGAKGSPVSFVIKSMSFIFKGTVDGDITLGVEGDVEMDIPAAFGDAPPDLIFSMVNSEQSGTETVSASIELKDDAGWQNAFGLKGLTLYDLTFAFGLQVSAVPIPLPTIGVRASARLPSAVRDPIGMPDDAVITAFGNLAEETPCLGINVTVPTGKSENIVSIAGGVVTASEFDLYVAPAGCQIATTQYPKGIALSLKGSVLGTTVDIGGKLDLDPFAFDVNVDVGAFQAGPLQMMETRIGVHMETDPNAKPGLGTSLDDSVSFSGGFDLFGTTVTASGELVFVNGVTEGDLEIATNGFTVEGFSITDVDFSATVKSSVVSNSFDIKGSGKVGVLGSSLDVKAFEFAIANNVVDKISANVEARLPGPADTTIDGTFDLEYASSPRSFDIGASATLGIGDFSLVGGEFDINDKCASLQATLSLPGVVDASVAGYLVYQSGCSIPNLQRSASIPVAGGAGSFCAYAAVNDISVGPFTAAGTVHLANNQDATCSGTGGAAGDLAGSLEATLRLGAQSASNTVNVNGGFGSNGVFDLSGSSSIDIAGFDIAMNVRALRDASGVSVSGQGSVNLLGNTVSLSGSFSNENGYPTTNLTGTASTFELGGYRPGSTSFTLIQSSSRSYLSGDIALNLGLVKMNATATFANSPSGVLFYVTDGVSFGISASGMSLSNAGFTATLTNCTSSDCSASAGRVSLSMSGHFSLLQWSFSTGTIFIATSGDFSASASASGSVGVDKRFGWKALSCSVSVGASYSVNADFGERNGSPFVNASGSASAHAYGCTLGGSVGSNIELSPFRVCVPLTFTLKLWFIKHTFGPTICMP